MAITSGYRPFESKCKIDNEYTVTYMGDINMRCFLLLVLILISFESHAAPAWYVGKINEVGVDFRGGDPAGSGQLYVKMDNGNYYNLKWIKTTYPGWWSTVYSTILNAYTSKVSINIEYDDTTNEIRYITLK